MAPTEGIPGFTAELKAQVLLSYGCMHCCNSPLIKRAAYRCRDISGLSEYNVTMVLCINFPNDLATIMYYYVDCPSLEENKTTSP